MRPMPVEHVFRSEQPRCGHSPDGMQEECGRPARRWADTPEGARHYRCLWHVGDFQVYGLSPVGSITLEAH